MEVGVWLPVYGGWLRVKDHHRAPTVQWCREIAHVADATGYRYLYASENLLNCVYGPEHDVMDVWVTLAGIASDASNMSLIGATKPGFMNPLILAQMIKTLSQNGSGKVGVSIVCGWWRKEFEQCGVPWLNHGQRYQRAGEFTECLQLLWKGDSANFNGDYFTLKEARLSGTTLECDSPQIWISGHSVSAINLAVGRGDVIFINSMSDDELRKLVSLIRKHETIIGRRIKVAMSVFVILEESEQKAMDKYDWILRHRSDSLIQNFRSIMAESEASVWAGLSDEQMVDSNCGFDAALIGTQSSIAERIRALEGIGIDIIMCQFDDMADGTRVFGEKVLPELT